MSNIQSMPDPIAKRLGYVLKRAQHALRSRLDKEMSSYEITAPQYAVLSAIFYEPGISNAALARAAFITPQSMQGIIATLEKRGLLKRSPDPDHGRRLKAVLTPAGMEILKVVDKAVIKVEALMMSSMKNSDAEKVTKILLTCIDDLSHE
jgi:DNA-binding MarR family transcriptional regulator